MPAILQKKAANESGDRAIQATIFGRVQGVGFRYHTRHVAYELGLTGWVRNNRDGTVEVYAEGPVQNLVKFEDFLRVGPPWSVVSRIELHRLGAQHLFDAFRIDY